MNDENSNDGENQVINKAYDSLSKENWKGKTFQFQLDCVTAHTFTFFHVTAYFSSFYMLRIWLHCSFFSLDRTKRSYPLTRKSLKRSVLQLSRWRKQIWSQRLGPCRGRYCFSCQVIWVKLNVFVKIFEILLSWFINIIGHCC